MSEQYKIRSINDMVVTVDGGQGLSMQDMVYLGDKRLIGEVVGVDSEKVTVQVYESTTGLAPGQPVYSTGGPMTIQLGPGLLRGIFDGIARPLEAIHQVGGAFIPAGLDLSSLDGEKKWDVHVTVKVGDQVKGGAVIAECR